jgi:hypothetical protein
MLKQCGPIGRGPTVKRLAVGLHFREDRRKIHRVIIRTKIERVQHWWTYNPSFLVSKQFVILAGRYRTHSVLILALNYKLHRSTGTYALSFLLHHYRDYCFFPILTCSYTTTPSTRLSRPMFCKPSIRNSFWLLLWQYAGRCKNISLVSISLSFTGSLDESASWRPASAIL